MRWEITRCNEFPKIIPCMIDRIQIINEGFTRKADIVLHKYESVSNSITEIKIVPDSCLVILVYVIRREIKSSFVCKENILSIAGQSSFNVHGTIDIDLFCLLVSMEYISQVFEYIS